MRSAGAELVARAVHRLDRITTRGAQLGAHPAHVAVDGAVGDHGPRLVGAAHQVVAREDLPGTLDEHAQDAELGHREDDLAALPERLELVEVERQAPVAEDPGAVLRRTRLARRAPQDRAHAGHQLARAERRSEEHTSELQSLAYLVCRLLLEKKKQKNA